MTPEGVSPARSSEVDVVTARYRQHVNAGQGRLAALLGLPLEHRAEGCYVWDSAGIRYLDCGGYGVFTLGHRHPTVVAAVAAQLARQPLSTRLFLSPVLAEAAERFIDVAPAGQRRVTFTNSGAEAVEFALKLARSRGYGRVVAMWRGFHGKTLAALSVSGRDRYRDPFRPLLSGVEHVAFGDAPALRRALANGPPAAVLLEPVQAEGGVRIPPSGYLRDVRSACDQYGALLIVDEIQTGLGRLGRWWGCDRDDVSPDILLAGKALGGGVIPVAVVASTLDAYAALDAEPMLHSSTFAGNPLATAAVVASLRVMREQDVPGQAAALGNRLLAGLREALRDTDDIVADVRGDGLMIGIDFRASHHGAQFLESMLDRRVIVSYSLNQDNVVRLTPPFLLSPTDCDWLLTAVNDAVRCMRRPSSVRR